MTPDTSGPASLVPLAYYDPVSSCWKTSGAIFPSDWPTFSETCPPWGMTRGGELFALPTPELPTVGRASSSLPTPTARDHKGHNQRRDSTCLTGALLPTPELPTVGHASSSLLPTPVADNSRGLPSATTDFQSLPNAVIALMPTPAVNDMGEGKTPEAWDEWTARMRARHGNGNGHGNSLAIEAQRLLPTPQAGDAVTGANLEWPRNHTPSPYGDLPRTVAMELMASSSGAPMAPPSPDGSPSPDDQLPGQLSLDATAPD